jgi:5'-nucleotidase
LLKQNIGVIVVILMITSLIGAGNKDIWPKRVLITNDNGINDSKIIELAREFSKIAETTIVASIEDRSGSTNYALALTTGKVRVFKKNIDKNFDAFAVKGYPADCVLVGIKGIMKDHPPDLVVSGINGGPNLAFEWIGSGTIGAARIASIFVPAIAVSGLNDGIPGSLNAVVKWVVKFAQSQIVQNLKPTQYLTISIPAIPFDQIKGVRIAKRAGMFIDFGFLKDQKDHNQWIINPVPKKVAISEDTDHYLYKAGYIAIVPMKLDEHDYGLYNKIKADQRKLIQIKSNLSSCNQRSKNQ